MTDPAPPAAEAEALRRYWRANVIIMSVLLTIWAIVGLGCGILFADALNQFKIGGYPLGFWFAQQGSIMTFVVIILVYCILLNRLDNKHHEALEKIKQSGGAA
jgi:putative solute:sodium symporter small subunit